MTEIIETQPFAINLVTKMATYSMNGLENERRQYKERIQELELEINELKNGV